MTKKLGAITVNDGDEMSADAGDKSAEVGRPSEKLTANAFECVTKVTKDRQPLEQNLVLSILHKVFKAIDQRVAKKFNVLANLVNKLKAVTLKKGDIVVHPQAPIDTIYVMYSGQVEQSFS